MMIRAVFIIALAVVIELLVANCNRRPNQPLVAPPPEASLDTSERSCGSPNSWGTREFRAVVRSVNLLSQYSGPVKFTCHPRRAGWLLELEVVKGDESRYYRKGDVVRYAIHSPSRLLRTSEWQDKDFAFREKCGGPKALFGLTVVAETKAP
jgi:hypothetical protein